jgi:hypothetical protein
MLAAPYQLAHNAPETRTTARIQPEDLIWVTTVLQPKEFI